MKRDDNYRLGYRGGFYDSPIVKKIPSVSFAPLSAVDALKIPSHVYIPPALFMDSLGRPEFLISRDPRVSLAALCPIPKSVVKFNYDEISRDYAASYSRFLLLYVLLSISLCLLDCDDGVNCAVVINVNDNKIVW